MAAAAARSPSRAAPAVPPAGPATAARPARPRAARRSRPCAVAGEQLPRAGPRRGRGRRRRASRTPRRRTRRTGAPRPARRPAGRPGCGAGARRRPARRPPGCAPRRGPGPAATPSASSRAGTSAGRLACRVPQPAVVAGVERGQQIGHLGAAHLADDQPVRAHPQRLPHQVPQRHLTDALDVRRPGEQPDDVRVRGRELGGVLAEHQAVRRGRPRPAAPTAAWSSPSRCRR